MSKKNMRTKKQPASRQGGSSPVGTDAKEPSPSEKVAREDLGEFVGITMDARPKAAQAEAPQDEVVFSVPEDRARLLIQGVLYLLLAFFGLFLVAGGIGATQISGNLAYMILVVIGLPVAWFASKAMGRRIGKFLSRANVIDFGKRGVFLYEGADPKKARYVSYKDIKNYTMVRHGRSLRLLLSGSWVTHPSGLYFVDMNRPFMESTLPDLEADVKRIMREHRVNARR